MPTILIGDEGTGPFRIETDATGLLGLPSIRIRPDNLNPPHVQIKQVRAEVRGNPKGVLVLGPAFASGKILRRFDKPYSLIEEIEILPVAVYLARQEFPPGEYLLWVEVMYQHPPAFPGAKPGKEILATKERFLQVTDARPIFPGAEWKHRELIVGRTPAELTISAEHLPRDVVPAVAVFDPNNVLNVALRDALNQQLNLVPPRLLGEHDPKGRTVFEQTIDLRFDGPKRPATVPLRVSFLKRVPKASGGPEKVELVGITLSGENALKVDFKDNLFLGYPILDLGTSSTFALIYDPGLTAGFLPVEQEQTFRTTLFRWFNRKDGLFGKPEWQSLLTDVVKQIRAPDPGKRAPAEILKGYLMQWLPAPNDIDRAVHTVLRCLESSGLISNFSPEFRLALRRELSGMYTRAFRRFPLREKWLEAVDLDLNAALTESPEGAGAIVEPIPSTTAVISCHPLTVDIGPEAETCRRQTGSANPIALLTQFHSSPKNYYPLLGLEGESVRVSAGGEVVEVSPRAFLVASLKRLRERMDEYRKKTNRGPQTRFSKIVMPFPTSASMRVRQEIRMAATEAGFDRPIADLDEALSAVVFYLVNPFGADLEMGLESFRTSCRPIYLGDGLPPRKWTQNILLIDVGGGTTDIALVEVLLTDTQAEGTGDGCKGRYYKLTPSLLGATGRDQLAGNLLSLAVFHALKKQIADTVLAALASAPSEGEPTGEEDPNIRRLFEVARTLEHQFKDETGTRYRPGTLLEHYLNNQLWLKDGDPLGAYAFDLANKILPTAWQNAPEESRSAVARTFHALWQIAEDFKVKIFGKGQAEEGAISQEQLASLLGISVTACEQLGIGSVPFSRDSFRKTLAPPLTEIACLALDLAKNGLPKTQNNRLLDRIILTGQTCRLDCVREIVTEVFQAECEKGKSGLRWDPSALTFEEDYAKRAAGLGAAFAYQLREHRVKPRPQDVLTGNVLDVDIDNLFFFLQSGFRLRRPADAGGPQVLLAPGQRFEEFNAEGVGYLRSKWDISPMEMLEIDRFDFETHGGVLWGVSDCAAWLRPLACRSRTSGTRFGLPSRPTIGWLCPCCSVLAPSPIFRSQQPRWWTCVRVCSGWSRATARPASPSERRNGWRFCTGENFGSTLRAATP